VSYHVAASSGLPFQRNNRCTLAAAGQRLDVPRPCFERLPLFVFEGVSLIYVHDSAEAAGYVVQNFFDDWQIYP
jgi:hypothetical protein